MGLLKLFVFGGSVVYDEIDNDFKFVFMCFFEEVFKVIKVIIVGMYVFKVGDIIVIIFQGRFIKGQQRDISDVQIFKIVQFFNQAIDVVDIVIVIVVEGMQGQGVDNVVFVLEVVVVLGYIKWLVQVCFKSCVYVY